MGKHLKPPIREAIDPETWKDQIDSTINLAKTLNLQNVELRLPFGLGEVNPTVTATTKNNLIEAGKVRRTFPYMPREVRIANFLTNPPHRVYSYLLFVYKDEIGKGVSQYLEMKLTANTGAAVIKDPRFQYVRAGSKGRLLYLRIPVTSTKTIDELVIALMNEAHKLYLTVCETIKEKR